MKHLTIIRHAKSEDISGYPSDFDRPLTHRGKKDASRMGKFLGRHSPDIDWLISSPAKRAQETTERIVERISLTRNIVWEQHVYEATAAELRVILADVPTTAGHVAIVGHNPGMENLVAGLCSGNTSRGNFALATGGVAQLELDIFQWNQIRWGSGRLQLLLRPKLLRKKKKSKT